MALLRCELVQEQIDDYLEGAVTAPMRLALELHFQECSQCRQEMESLREVYSFLRRAQEVNPPPELAERILRHAELELELRRYLKQHSHWQTWAFLSHPRRAFIAVGLALLALLLIPRSALDRAAVTMGFPSLRFPTPLSTSSRLFFDRPELVLSRAENIPAKVGQEFGLNVEITPREDLNNAQLVVYRQTQGLIIAIPGIPNKEGGRILWQGSLPAGEDLKVPLRFIGREKGVYSILLHLVGDTVDLRRIVYLPVGVGQKRLAGQILEGKMGTDQALQELSRAFGIPIALDLYGLPPKPMHLVLTTPGKAIAQVAAHRNMQWNLSEGVYNVFRSSP